MVQRLHDDMETARRIREDDPVAVRAFIDSHYSSLLRFLLHLTGVREDAEDLAQQAFVKAKVRIGSYAGRSPLKTWLYKIALHEYTHWRRRHKPAEKLSLGIAHIEARFQTFLEADALLSALDRLPELQRKAFLLQEVEQLSVQEISAVLGIPQGTVKSRVFKARKQLAKLLDQSEEEEVESQPVYES